LDEEFTSRFHVALHLPNLDDTGRARIWQHNLDLLEKEHENISIPTAARNYCTDGPDLKAVQWNGREIRNGEQCILEDPSSHSQITDTSEALQTAVAFAEYEAHENGESRVTLKKDHLQRIVRMSAEFKGHLKSIKDLTSGSKPKVEEHGLDYGPQIHQGF
jgi:hypothetical protein